MFVLVVVVRVLLVVVVVVVVTTFLFPPLLFLAVVVLSVKLTQIKLNMHPNYSDVLGVSSASADLLAIKQNTEIHPR